jgi:hypothetical protein
VQWSFVSERQQRSKSRTTADKRKEGLGSVRLVNGNWEKAKERRKRVRYVLMVDAAINGR